MPKLRRGKLETSWNREKMQQGRWEPWPWSEVKWSHPAHTIRYNIPSPSSTTIHHHTKRKKKVSDWSLKDVCLARAGTWNGFFDGLDGFLAIRLLRPSLPVCQSRKRVKLRYREPCLKESPGHSWSYTYSTRDDTVQCLQIHQHWMESNPIQSTE